MIHFHLNIDLYYEFESNMGSKTKAIACIEYPVLHIIAKTREIIEEEYDHIDRFIVDMSKRTNGISVKNIAAITGINENVFAYRTRELEKQKFVVLENGDNIIPEKLGLEFLENEKFEREVIKTRSFLLDGVTHKPLPSYFYKEGRDNLISDAEVDKKGVKHFNPVIIHNPPQLNLKSNILDIAIDLRASYNIPVGIKDILDFDFNLMTYPVAIQLSQDTNGGTHKKLIDCNGFYVDKESVSHWQKDLLADIRKSEITLVEFDKSFDGKTTKQIQFQNNWGKPRTEISKRLFNIDWTKASALVSRLFDANEITKENLIVDDYGIRLRVNEGLFRTKKINKKRLINACIRGRDYLRQLPRTGVWLVFVDVEIADNVVQGLIELYKQIQSKISVQELLEKYEFNFRKLREDIILIERFDYLEDLDCYLFMHPRTQGEKMPYLILNG